jgi:hypothetical protein
MRPFALLLLVLGFGFAAGCGSVGDPLYPALNIPARITDLSALERGDKLEVHFTVPLRTTEGQIGKPVGSVELRVGPNDQPTFEINKWSSAAQRIDVSPLVAPGQIQSVQIDVGNYIGKDLILAVRAANSKDRYSDWSPLLTVSIVQPLPTPSNFKAEPVPEGVRLTWTAANVTDFKVYRKAPEQSAASQLAIVAQPNFLDTGTEFDKTYEYYVEGVHEKITSELAGPVTATPKDNFPPGVPAGLTSSNGIGSIELAWERNTDRRFKEYRLYRAEDNGAFAQIAEGLDIPSFSDHNVQAGKRYRYRLVAVGQNGLASQPSEPIEAIAP